MKHFNLHNEKNHTAKKITVALNTHIDRNLVQFFENHHNPVSMYVWVLLLVLVQNRYFIWVFITNTNERLYLDSNELIFRELQRRN